MRPFTPKHLDLAALLQLREKYRREGKRVVWTNGCFDLLHAGHVASLEAAKALGDILIVGLNSDRSVRLLKGDERPFLHQEDRIRVLSALACVDHILLFEGMRCTEELAQIQPDIYVKSADYSLDTINREERQAIEAGGGEIRFLPLVEGRSTSNLVKKIRRSDPEKIITAAFAFLRDEAGRLLLVANRYEQGIRWGLPGGGHLRNETLPETAIRETREETGLEITIERYRGLIERLDPSQNLHLLAHLFEAKVIGGALTIHPGEEHVIAAQYFDREAMANHPEMILGREHLLRYLADPTTFPPYIRMGPGEE